MIVTASKYAELIDKSAASIVKRLKIEKTLPGAISIEKWGNTWRIEIDEHFDGLVAGNDFSIKPK